jgi:hypothetical protein
MEPRLEFYEVVRVLPCEQVPKRLWDTCGVVVGRADAGSQGWEYATQLFADNNQCWQLPEKCLQSEGRKMKREELYDGDSFAVVVDRQTGQGSRKEPG